MAQAAGGLLFRCEMCAAAFCEDHLPSEAQVIVTCTRFQNFGQAQPKQVRLRPTCGILMHPAVHDPASEHA